MDEENKKARYVVEEIGTDKGKKEEIIEKVGTPQEEIIEPEKVKEPEKIVEVVSEKPIVKIKKESSFNILWILIPGMITLGLLIGGIFAYIFGLKRISDGSPTPTPQAQESTIPVVSPSASPSANLTKYKITILNGSGIAGEAGRMQTLLEAAGFVVLGTGNADSYDFTKTQIKLASNIDSTFVSSLTTLLGKTYQLVDPTTIASQTSDVVIVVGSLKAK